MIKVTVWTSCHVWGLSISALLKTLRQGVWSDVWVSQWGGRWEGLFQEGLILTHFRCRTKKEEDVCTSSLPFILFPLVFSLKGEEGQNITWKIWMELSTSHRQLKMSEPWMSYLLNLQGWDQIFFMIDRNWWSCQILGAWRTMVCFITYY